jgi:hypothetical protein
MNDRQGSRKRPNGVVRPGVKPQVETGFRVAGNEPLIQ